MSIAREPVEIRASNGTLWIGDSARPLHTVTRATTTELRPNHRTAVRHYAITVSVWLFPATIVSVASPDAISALVTITALTWFATRTLHLAKFLRTSLYELRLETTSGRHRVLVTDNAKAASDLAFTITDAVDNPTTEFSTRAEHIPPAHETRRPIREEPPNRINQP